MLHACHMHACTCSCRETLPMEAMDEAIRLHNTLVRKLLAKYHGYESATEGDAFIMGFHTADDALQFATDLQQSLITQPWPAEVLQFHLAVPTWAEVRCPYVCSVSALGSLQSHIRAWECSLKPASCRMESCNMQFVCLNATSAVNVHVVLACRHCKLRHPATHKSHLPVRCSIRTSPTTHSLWPTHSCHSRACNHRAQWYRSPPCNTSLKQTRFAHEGLTCVSQGMRSHSTL